MQQDTGYAPLSPDYRRLQDVAHRAHDYCLLGLGMIQLNRADYVVRTPYHVIAKGGPCNLSDGGRAMPTPNMWARLSLLIFPIVAVIWGSYNEQERGIIYMKIAGSRQMACIAIPLLMAVIFGVIGGIISWSKTGAKTAIHYGFGFGILLSIILFISARNNEEMTKFSDAEIFAVGVLFILISSVLWILHYIYRIGVFIVLKESDKKK